MLGLVEQLLCAGATKCETVQKTVNRIVDSSSAVLRRGMNRW
jgi:hypothetical protein